MKKISISKPINYFSYLLLFALIALISGCTSNPDSLGVELPERSGADQNRVYPDIPPEAEEVLLIYEEAVRTRNPELFREIVDEEIEIGYTERSGNRTDMYGFEACAEFRLMFFEDFGPQAEFHLGEHGQIEGDKNLGISVEFRFPQGAEWIGIRKTGSNWKLNQILDFIDPPGEWVTNQFQTLTDYDKDGFLNGEEQNELIDLLQHFYSGPHSVSNQLDEYYDQNRDGSISGVEIQRAAEIHFVLGPLFWKEIYPGQNEEIKILDLNKDGKYSLEELERVRDYMSGGPEVPIDREELISRLRFVQFPDAVYQPVPREISSLIDQLADRNGDGVVDEKEQNVILESLSHAEREAVNYMEQAIDRNRDGWINGNDIFLALQDSAMGRGMVAEGSEPPYEVRTIIDRMLDTNGNEQVEVEEIENAVMFLSGRVELADAISPDMKEILDSNRDGRIETGEIEDSEGILLYPRPVGPGNSIDLALDENRDGFIDPEELGITVGVTNKGAIPPFEERIAMIRRRGDEGTPVSTSTTSADTNARAPAGSEYYKKLGIIQDKKLAVVTLTIGTEKVDQETANGVIVFVENAFVNIGKVKVVDRANIQEIFKEYKFQASGVIDESTAVEIGKLSGADIIVIGSINRVGGVFYLNIKLITVKTAEIIGSSISQAGDATGFLEMANQAVYKLF